MSKQLINFISASLQCVIKLVWVFSFFLPQIQEQCFHWSFPWLWLVHPLTSCIYKIIVVQHHSSIHDESCSTTRIFARARIRNVCDILISQLLKSCVKGGDLKSTYIRRIHCHFWSMQKQLARSDAPPLKVDDLCAKLLTLWKYMDKWGITSLGKEFYEFYFSSIKNLWSA